MEKPHLYQLQWADTSQQIKDVEVPALGIAAISSFVAGTMSLVGLIFFAPVLAHFALAFGPPEYFALMFMGLSSVISLSGCALLKGLIDVWVALIFG